MKISRKLKFLVTFSNIVTIALFLIIILFMVRNSLLRTLKENGENLATMVAYQVAPSIEFEDTVAITNSLQPLRNYPNITFVKIFGIFGEEITSLEISKKNAITIIKSIESNNEVIGGISIGIDPSPANNLFKTITISLIGIGLLIFVISFILISWLGTSITRPIFSVTKSLDNISLGEGDLTQKLDYKGKDEMGELSNSFNTFTDGIRNIISNIKNTSSDVDSLIVGIVSSIEELSATVEEISANTSETTDIVKLQDKEINTMKTNIDLIESNTENVFSSIKDAKQYIDEILVNVKNGTSSIGNVEKSINELNRILDYSSEKSSKVSDISEVLSSITENIISISKRIDLLALNASIEAARVGEYGGGFRVISEEIRGLSFKTEDFSTNVDTYLTEIKENIDQLSNEIKNSQEQFSKTKQSISELTNVFYLINDRLDKFSNSSMNLIFDSQKENSKIINNFGVKLESFITMSKKVFTSIEEISAALEEETASFEEINANSQNITTVTKKLSDEVKKFKT